MKFNDEFANAEVTLQEAINLLNQLKSLKGALRSFQEWKEEVNQNITFPIYMRESVQALMDNTISNFGIIYPNLQTHFKNGDGEGVASSRLSSAILTISAMTDELKTKRYLIRSEDEREHLKIMVLKSIQHMLLFVYTQYRLNRYPFEEYLPLFTYCEKEEILVEDFKETIEELKKQYKAYNNIYEMPSSLADDFLSAAPELYQKAEELQYPLTPELAERALSSSEEMSKLRESIDKVSRENITIDSSVSHEDVLRKLQLR